MSSDDVSRGSRFAEFVTGFSQADSSDLGPQTASELEQEEIPAVTAREMKIYNEASAFEGAAVVAMIEREDDDEAQQKVLEITMEDGVTMTLELDSGEKRLNELGYRQRLKRVVV